MSLLHKFESNAIRYGYIIDEVRILVFVVDKVIWVHNILDLNISCDDFRLKVCYFDCKLIDSCLMISEVYVIDASE